jgi:predicted dehydrogenase
MTGELRFGIVGTGVAGNYHAAGISQTPGARLVAVCGAAGGAESARTRELAARFSVEVEPSFESLIRRTDIDAVCICTPSGIHAMQSAFAAQAGKHVLVEKPMALTLADADLMIAECRAESVRLGVSLQRRTDPMNLAVRAAVEQGALGELVLGSITIPYLRTQAYYDSAAWRGTYELDGGGVLMNQGIHLVDLLLWFMGDVKRVVAFEETLGHELQVEDTLTAALRFANGALGTITATTCAAPGFPHRVEVYGTRGGIQIEGDRIIRWECDVPNPFKMSEIDTPIEAGAGASATGISAEGHGRVVQDFVQAIREGREPLISGPEGRRSVATVLSVYEAGRAVTSGA